MSIGLDELLAACRRVDRRELTLWVERHWVRPRHEGARWVFSEIDVARVELICDLRRDLDVNDEAVPVVLSLLDTVHGLRRRLALLAEAIGTLPPEARQSLAAALERLEGDAG